MLLEVTYWDGKTVCDVLGWLNDGASHLKDVQGMDVPIEDDAFELNLEVMNDHRGGTNNSSGLKLDISPFSVNRFARNMHATTVHELFHNAADRIQDKREKYGLTAWSTEGPARMFEDIVYDSQNPYNYRRYYPIYKGNKLETILERMYGITKLNAEAYRSFLFFKLMQTHKCLNMIKLMNDTEANFNDMAQTCKNVPGDNLAGAFVLYNWAIILYNNISLFEGDEPSKILGINMGIENITVNMPNFQDTLDFTGYTGTSLPPFSAKSFLITKETLKSGCGDINLTLEGGDVKLTAIRVKADGSSDINDNFSIKSGDAPYALTREDRDGGLFITVTNTTKNSANITTLTLTKDKDDNLNLTGQAGAMKMTLSWTYQCDVDMDLTMTGNDAVVYDIKDVEGAGKEHLVIPSLFDIKPGDYYVFNANGKQLPDSTVTEEMLAEDPIEVRALLETTKGDYFNVWPVESFASLDIGDFAKVNVYEEIDPEWICPALSDVPGWKNLPNPDTGNFDCLYCPSLYTTVWKPAPPAHLLGQIPPKGYYYCKRPYRPRVYTGGGGGGRTYNACSEEEKKSTCGCVPCDYIVTGLKKRIENGPIAGAKVEIIKAMDADAINPTVLYRGSTTDKEDIFQSGLLEIPDTTLDTFIDDEYYLLLAEGGKDIDRDDDMVRDSVPTDNNGTIHAIIKGSDLKKLPFRVNILTEAIYQVSGDSIGYNYDAVTLQEKLDDTAQKLINHKLYPGDDSKRINYKDVLLWTPAVDKKALYKPFTTYVEPIITSLYADKERFDESYRLIYEPYASNAPQLEPLALDIPEGLDNDSVIAQVKTGNKKVFDHVVLQGNFSEHFSIDNDGYIHIVQSQLIEDGNRYRLLMKAVDVAGREGSLVSLTIEVNGKLAQADPTTSKPRFISAETFDISENAPEGTVVANTHFEDSNQTIVSYALSGQDSSMFVVDNQGIVRVAPNADIDYEKSKVYHFKISAKNDAGKESYPVGIAIAIINQLDTPLFDLVVFERIEENIPLGTVITTIRTDRVGLGAIEKFEILSPHMPFTIDSNGTMYVSNYIDYEQKKQYDFYAIARTKYGNSNKIEIHISIDDQRPEVGVPSLEALTLSVDENITSGSKIGQLVLDGGATAIERIALYGEDDNFRVDANGSIYLADDATLDYETKTRYDLGARALNSRGWGNEVHIVIHVNNIADELPTLENFRKSVEENATVGTVIGKIITSGTSETAIDSFELTGTGNENFTIDVNGTIRVSQAAQLDYESNSSYLLQAIASSTVGSSAEVEVIIYILNVPENPPVLKPLTLSIEENASIGTVVGTVEEDVGGDTPIVSYSLDDNSTFSIDKNGTIVLHRALDYETQSEYVLSVTASNDVGQSDAVTVTIEVEDIDENIDRTKPVITLLEGDSIWVRIGQDYTEYGATALDDTDGDITENITIVSNVDTAVEGIYAVNYSVSDEAGNKADILSRTVYVYAKGECNASLSISREVLLEKINHGDDVTQVNTCAVTDMHSLFSRHYFNQDIGEWDVSSVTNMSAMFDYARFNQDISRWDVSNVTNMARMFYMANSFNQSLGDWDVSNVSTMAYMFGRSPFNQPIGDWDVSSVTDMSGMFRSTPFNQPIGRWDVSSVIDMNWMFGFTSFNQPIGEWDVSNVTNMFRMFFYTLSFNQSIWQWDVSNVSEHREFAENSLLEDKNNPFIPSIKLEGNTTVNILAGDEYVDAGATAVNYRYGDITNDIIIQSNVDTSRAGTYTVTYRVSDEEGNQAAVVTRTVVVKAWLKSVLKDKCNIDYVSFDNNFDRNKGIYSGSIYCGYRGLTDGDLASFSILTAVTTGIDLSHNSLTNLDGLRRLKGFGFYLYI